MASTSNVVPTESKGLTMMAVMWTLTMIATTLVIVRLGVRRHILHNVGLDDWLIGLSMVLGLGFVAAATVSVQYGYGHHYEDLSPECSSKALMWNMISFIFGIAAFALPKLAVAALLDRILNPGLLSRIALWGLTGTASLVALINILFYISECNPREALWIPTMVGSGEATCRDIWILIRFATFNGAFSAFVDLYLAMYPGFVFFRLQMSLQKRIVLTAGFGLGSIAAATAMVKCAQLKGLADLNDPTYATVPLVIWTNVETNVIAIAACIPTLKPVPDLVLRRLGLFSTENREYSDANRAYNRELDIRRTDEWRVEIELKEDSTSTRPDLAFA